MKKFKTLVVDTASSLVENINFVEAENKKDLIYKCKLENDSINICKRIIDIQNAMIGANNIIIKHLENDITSSEEIVESYENIKECLKEIEKYKKYTEQDLESEDTKRENAQHELKLLGKGTYGTVYGSKIRNIAIKSGKIDKIIPTLKTLS